MEPHPIVPEYLHKDELSYELEVRGINTEGLNVSDLRSIFRKSRDVKENPAVCTNSEIFHALDKVLIFCHDRFQLIKDLVENTDCSSISIDFPRYLHRLHHVSTRLRHLVQFGKLASDVWSDTLKLPEDVHQYVQHIIAQLDSFQKSQLPGEQPTTAVSYPTVQPPPASDFQLVDSQVPTHLTVSNPTAVTCLPSQVQSLSPSQLISPLINHDSNTRGDYFHFAKLPNPVQKMLESLNVTDGLNVSDLVKFLRTLVHLRLMAPAFCMSTAHILHMVYPYTSGPIASKTLATIHSGDTLDVYHEQILAFFIPPRTRLPLLNALYYRRQNKNEPLATYVADIKEMAAVFRQDINQSVVVQNILDGLHACQRSSLAFCERPHSYAELDNMCVYAHNVEGKGYSVGNELSTHPVASISD
jgi:hypothetical protein